MSLVNSDLVLSSFSEVDAGDIVEGWISKKKWNGQTGFVVVHFFDHLKGQVLNVEKDRFDGLKLAQTVKCRVIQVDSTLLLTFDLEEPNQEIEKQVKAQSASLEAGHIVEQMKILAFSEKHNGFILEASDKKALLPIDELSDFISLKPLWAKKYQVGDFIGPLLITGKYLFCFCLSTSSDYISAPSFSLCLLFVSEN